MKVSLKWKSCHDNPPVKEGRYLLAFFGFTNDNKTESVFDWCEAQYKPDENRWIPCDNSAPYQTLHPYRWSHVTLPAKPSVAKLKTERKHTGYKTTGS